MRINPPVDPLFRVGEIGLGYDKDRDLIVLFAKEILTEEDDPETAAVIRFWATRTQVKMLSRWGLHIHHDPIDPQRRRDFGDGRAFQRDPQAIAGGPGPQLGAHRIRAHGGPYASASGRTHEPVPPRMRSGRQMKANSRTPSATRSSSHKFSTM